MKKFVIFSLAILMLFSLGSIAGAKTLKVGLDAGPVSQDPQVQLSGGMLQFSHWAFDPLVRYAQNMEFEPRLAERWERLDDLI
jgi:peptide/nickel transport system substrate-binding protein